MLGGGRTAGTLVLVRGRHSGDGGLVSTPYGVSNGLPLRKTDLAGSTTPLRVAHRQVPRSEVAGVGDTLVPAECAPRFTPDIGRLGLDGARVSFRTSPSQLHQWLRRIDRWIAYANSVVSE